MFQDGFYKVAFSTPLGHGCGVAYLAGGDLHGGDSMMAYAGTYSVNGDEVTAQVRVFVHSREPNMSSVLGTNTANLSLAGIAAGNTATLTGVAPEAPNAKVTLKLLPLG